MEIGRLETESGPEWVVYDPVASIISKQNCQITVDGLGKINASKPHRRGELEYFDPKVCCCISYHAKTYFKY